MKTLKKALMLAILAMFVASVGLVPTTIQKVYAENEGPSKVAAEKLIDIAEKALIRTKAVIAASASANITIPQATKDNIAQAEALLAQAKSNLASGDVRAAVDKAIEAMKHLREALAQIILPQEERKEIRDEEKIIGLSNAINRTARFIARLENMTNVVAQRLDTLAQKGVNVTVAKAELVMARADLTDASNHLAQAKKLLGQGDIPGAAKEHGLAQSTAAKALRDIREASKPQKHERVREFVDKFDKRLNQFEEKLNKLADKIPPEALQRIRERIAETKERLNVTRAEIGHGDFEKAIDRLEDSLERLERAAERLEEQKPAIGAQLEKAIQALEMNLEKLEKRTHAAENKGKAAEKLAEVKEKLEQLKQKLEEIKQDIKNDHHEDASEKIGQIEKKIDELAEKLGNVERA